MLPQVITSEQQYLQSLWNRCVSPGHVAYAEKEGWWVVLQDSTGQLSDLLFLGRVVEEAQQSIKEKSMR